MIQRIKCCEKCRETLRDAGYQVTEIPRAEGWDTCDICGHNADIVYADISKGKEAAPNV